MALANETSETFHVGVLVGCYGCHGFADSIDGERITFMCETGHDDRRHIYHRSKLELLSPLYCMGCCAPLTGLSLATLSKGGRFEKDTYGIEAWADGLFCPACTQDEVDLAEEIKRETWERGQRLAWERAEEERRQALLALIGFRRIRIMDYAA